MSRDFRNSPIDGDCARHSIGGFIKDFIAHHGYSPSVREVMKGCGYKSTSTVQHHLDVMKAKGQLTYEPHIARSIRLSEELCQRIPS